MENISLIILLLFGVSFLGVLSKRFKFPFPIALVLSGLLISLIPGLPTIALQPYVVFIVFLPPLLYGAAWNTSWHEFKTYRRAISLAAVGLVLLTTTIVAIVAHFIIPDITWPLCFLIGAIVSPSDAVSATTVTGGLGLDPRLITIIEGESLVNDASGLVAYKYALTAVLAGNFIFWQAGLNFIWVVIAGVAIGLLIGFLMYLVHKNFICEPVIEVTLTCLTPFASYLIAEYIHVSGIIAVVTTGLYLSFRSDEIFTNESRIMVYSVWESILFILNGLIFILIGLQLRSVMEGIKDYSGSDLAFYGLAISAVVIVLRFIWVIPSSLIPSMLKRINTRRPFNSRNLVIFAWSGMRGVVSLAAALSIPLMMPDGTPFPHRNLIIYITFCVILTTLLLLGFSLPWAIKKLKIEPYSIAAEEYEVRTKVVNNTIQHIEENLSLVNGELLNNIKNKYEVKYNRLQKTDLPADYFGSEKPSVANIFNEYSKLQIDLIAVERKSLQQLHRSGEASEEIIRKIERELDLEETRLQLDMYVA
ncbi:MAG TPA: Na+/H+ antiporter [Puia sp.]|jgi:CPA1 family monovalent cation:H+ antiporter